MQTHHLAEETLVVLVLFIALAPGWNAQTHQAATAGTGSAGPQVAPPVGAEPGQEAVPADCSSRGKASRHACRLAGRRRFGGGQNQSPKSSGLAALLRLGRQRGRGRANRRSNRRLARARRRTIVTRLDPPTGRSSSAASLRVARAQFQRVFFLDGRAVRRVGHDRRVLAQMFGWSRRRWTAGRPSKTDGNAIQPRCL